MGRIETDIDAVPGCPSGLQDIPVSARDPMGGDIDLSGYVRNPDSRQAHIDLVITGAHCAGCVSKIEKGLTELPGVTAARMNLSTTRLAVNWNGQETEVNHIVRKLSDLGFGAAPYAVSEAERDAKAQTSFLLRCMAVAGFATMNVMLLSISVWSGGEDMSPATRDLLHRVSALITILAVTYAGRPFFRSALAALKKGQTNMDVPISLAIILATGLSVYETIKSNPHTYFDAAIMLVFLLLIGRYLDARMRARTGDAARKLAALQVTSATRMCADGRMETVPARDIQVGDIVFIPVGQRLAVDGDIIEGQSDLDTQIVTGESLPRPAGPGERAYSGMINLTAPLKIRVMAAHNDSFLSEITRLVEAGEQSKGLFVRIADRAARAYVPVVHTAAAVTFFGWLAVGADLRHAAICAIAVLIITCPCALGLAVPAVNIVTAGELFRRGVLVRSGDVLERLARVKSVIFDKTGTLTSGKPVLTNAATIDPESLAIAAALAKHSSHPLARALHGYDTGLSVNNAQETAGQGLSGIINGKRVRLGKASFIGADSKAHSGMESWLKIGNQNPMPLTFEDALRPEAKKTITHLHDLGLASRMISGDHTQITARLAKEAGIAEFHGNISPAGKLGIIDEAAASGLYPLMVGDGINDAPALAGAYASASLSSASDISRASADVILQHDSLSALPDTIRFARRAQARIKENLTLAVVYNVFAIPLAVLGHVTPLIAALAMSGSSLLVTLNALRMKRP